MLSAKDEFAFTAEHAVFDHMQNLNPFTDRHETLHS
jgi:hypothetical protein